MDSALAYNFKIECGVHSSLPQSLNPECQVRVFDFLNLESAVSLQTTCRSIRELLTSTPALQKSVQDPLIFNCIRGTAAALLMES